MSRIETSAPQARQPGARSRRHRGLAREVVLCAMLYGCAQNPPPAPQTAEAPVAQDACATYAKKLCGELGERSEACTASLSVLALLPARACAAALSDFTSTAARIADLRKACKSVADHVCAAVGQDSQSCQAITQNLPDIPPGHCLALARDEERLIAALREREAATAQVSDANWQALLEGQPPSFGPPDAKVVIVEFTDFECPFCAQAAETVNRLKKEYASKVRFVLRQFPLPFHRSAKPAARAALAAHDQGKFWQYHDLLFANQHSLDTDAFAQHAAKVGLAKQAFESAVAGASTAQRVEHDIELGTRVHVQGTPTMFVNKRRVENPIDYDSVQKQVDEALAAPSN